MKLSTILYQYIGELHVKFYQNWYSGFRDISEQNTEGHSFNIIRILRKKVVVNKNVLGKIPISAIWCPSPSPVQSKIEKIAITFEKMV